MASWLILAIVAVVAVGTALVWIVPAWLFDPDRKPSRRSIRVRSLYLPCSRYLQGNSKCQLDHPHVSCGNTGVVLRVSRYTGDLVGAELLCRDHLPRRREMGYRYIKRIRSDDIESLRQRFGATTPEEPADTIRLDL